MRKFIAALALGVAIVSPSAVAANTSVTVGLVKELSGAQSAVTLDWGSYTFPVVLKTNGSESYLTVRVTGLSNGIGVGASDVRISFSAPAAYSVSGNTVRRLHKTAKAGDVVYITVSVWQPIGSPRVSLSYIYKAKDAYGVYR
jgi:hypothetical protein